MALLFALHVLSKFLSVLEISDQHLSPAASAFGWPDDPFLFQHVHEAGSPWLADAQAALQERGPSAGACAQLVSFQNWTSFSISLSETKQPCSRTSLLESEAM